MATEGIAKEPPILDIPRTVLENVLDVLSAVGLVGMVAVALVRWNDLPATIPTHFGFDGQPDGWGSKGTLALLPVLSVALCIGLSVLERYPHKYNYAWPITAENVRPQYLNARQMVCTLKAGIVIVCGFLNWKTIEVALSRSEGLGFAMMLLTGGFILGPLVVFGARAYRLR